VNLVLFPQSNLHTLLPLRPRSVTLYYAGATGTTTAHAGARIRPAKPCLAWFLMYPGRFIAGPAAI
jgi:hypothetical protein